jgi:diaminopimelate decarboxylase
VTAFSYPTGWRENRPAIAVESGRYLVAGCGTLLTTIMDVKDTHNSRYVVCDAGVNALGGMYGNGRLALPRAQPANQSADGTEVVLAGPLCTPLDVLGRGTRIGDPSPAQVLAIPNVGAYGLTASLVAFLGRPLPIEVVIDGSDVVDVRQLAVVPRPVARHAG